MKRNCSHREYGTGFDPAQTEEIYEKQKNHSMTPLIDPMPLKITSKNGCNAKVTSGADLYVSMIAKNLRRFKGTSSFRNASGHGIRNKSLHKQLLARKPDQGNYDPLDAYQKNLADVKMNRQSKRKSTLNPGHDGGNEAFNNLQDGDYSSFKNKEKTVNFASIVPRDEVSFYSEIAVL